MSDYFGLGAPSRRFASRYESRRCAACGCAAARLHPSRSGAAATWTGRRAAAHRPADAISRSRSSRLLAAACARQDKKFVSDTERRERKLIAKDHGAALHFELDSSSRPVRTWQTLIDAQVRAVHAHAKSCRRRCSCSRNVELLYRLLDAENSPQCTGMLSTLKIWMGVMVAAHFGLRCHETLHYWFPVYDPAYLKLCAGSNSVPAGAGSCRPCKGVTLHRSRRGRHARPNATFANREHHVLSRPVEYRRPCQCACRDGRRWRCCGVWAELQLRAEQGSVERDMPLRIQLPGVIVADQRMSPAGSGVRRRCAVSSCIRRSSAALQMASVEPGAISKRVFAILQPRRQCRRPG